MLPISLETKHTKFHIGHSFMALGTFLGLLLSIFLATIPSVNAYAFGTNDIAILSNQERANNGIEPLSINEKLTTAAQAKADHMVSKGYFDHTAPDGTTGWYFISQQGYAYSTAGENLAASNEGAYAMVSGATGWMNSPGHRANLLNVDYTEVGYGIASAGDFRGYSNVYFVVALYAKPVSKQAIAAPDGSVPLNNATPSSGTLPGNPSTPTNGVNDTNAINVNGIESFSGTSTQLSKNHFRFSNNTVLTIATISGLLVVVGICIDIYRIGKHGGGIHTFHSSHKK